MKKTLLLFVFVSVNCFGQQSFDLIKSLNSQKKADILLKINLINNGSVHGEITPTDKEIIKDLELFLKDPFDKKISKFSLTESLRKLDDIKVYPLVSSAKNSGGQKNTEIEKVINYEDKVFNTFDGLSSNIPTGYSASTQIINALSQFLVDRTKQELTLTFYENFKNKLDAPIDLTLENGNKLTIELKVVFKNTYRLFDSKNYFDSPSLGQTWLIAFKKDLLELPIAIKEIISQNESISSTKTGHFAIVSFDAIDKIKKGKHPIEIIEELKDTHYDNNNKHEINQIIGLLELLSINLSKDEIKEGYKEIKWITVDELKSLDDVQKKYLVGLVYQMGRNNGLFTKPLFTNTQLILENYITTDNYPLLYQLIKKTASNYNLISQQLASLKQNKEKNDFQTYIDFLNTFYSVFDETIESYYNLIESNTLYGNQQNTNLYYQSEYYSKYRPIFKDVSSLNNAINTTQYAECLLLTNQLINHLFPEIASNHEVYKKITFYGNFMVDVVNTSENKGDLKLVIEKYAIPVSSYRIKRTENSSWDVNAYPGLYLAYEFSGSNSLSYGITAPIGISYSFMNSKESYANVKSSSSTFFLSVIDIGTPFSYRFNKDEAEGLPEDIKWEQVFSPGFFYIYGLKNSPLSIGLNAQFSPLLRKIEENNVLKSKNIFKVGLTLLVDIPLFNLSHK